MKNYLSTAIKKQEMKSVAVSIITVVFNGVHTLEDTIKSVSAQDYSDIEYVIVDGGSTDGTIDVIKKYDGRISKWVSEPDLGISDAMNKGIRMSSGDIVGIIHSDDYYEPGAINAVVNAFKEHPGAEVIHGDMRRLTAADVGIILKPHAETGKKVWQHVPFWHPTIFVKRWVYEKYGLYDLNFRMAMDNEIMLRFLKNGVKFFYLSQVLTNMRAGGASDKEIFVAWDECKEIALKYGFSKAKVYGYYLSRKIEKRTGNLLREWGLGGIADLYRKIFYSNA